MNLLGGETALDHAVAHEEVEEAEERGAPERGLQETEPESNPCCWDQKSYWGEVARAWPLSG